MVWNMTYAELKDHVSDAAKDYASRHDILTVRLAYNTRIDGILDLGFGHKKTMAVKLQTVVSVL